MSAPAAAPTSKAAQRAAVLKSKMDLLATGPSAKLKAWWCFAIEPSHLQARLINCDRKNAIPSAPQAVYIARSRSVKTAGYDTGLATANPTRTQALRDEPEPTILSSYAVRRRLPEYSSRKFGPGARDGHGYRWNSRCERIPKLPMPSGLVQDLRYWISAARAILMDRTNTVKKTVLDF